MTKRILDNVKDYYGKVIESSRDLKTSACTADKHALTKSVKEALSLINEEVNSRYFGCGITLPPALEGCSVLDLGCGAGRDCFCLSKLVGPNGRVTGIDMTPELLDIAKKNVDCHTKTFGYSKPNVEFKSGFIEQLDKAGIERESYDVIVSNCVINLSPDKEAVLSQAFTALKEGGELYFSDMYTDSKLSAEIKNDSILWGEGIAGALHWQDLLEMAKRIGFTTPILYKASPICLIDKHIQTRVGNAKFISATYRLFKLPKHNVPKMLVTYCGNIEGHEHNFKFDIYNNFKTNQRHLVSKELSLIFSTTRYAKYFRIEKYEHTLEKTNPFSIAYEE
ncbi:DgyrCDS14376 [Dimorphilus gyrociliatus]|uniref:Arsenite methyltransferase n=1 Tax=Dimorphilus gyrociliatus TaxID=2664684 RepID=A0A7I8WDL9_9ANNE|nr:DgyrCDS14376 [Dimorphilus gyrociliatus]